jgi:hypothetical protein
MIWRIKKFLASAGNGTEIPGSWKILMIKHVLKKTVKSQLDGKTERLRKGHKKATDPQYKCGVVLLNNVNCMHWYLRQTWQCSNQNMVYQALPTGSHNSPSYRM